MKWHCVADETPPIGPMLVYAASIDAYSTARWNPGGGWDFSRSIRGILDFSSGDSTLFGRGALITHWARLSRPRSNKVKAKDREAALLSKDAILAWALGRADVPGGGP